MQKQSINKLAKQISSANTSKKQKDSSKSLNKDKNIKDGWSQDVIPLAEVRDGICVTTDGSYVKIIELSASDYSQNNYSNKLRITSSYATMFTTSPVTVRVRVVTEGISLAPLIKNIQRAKYITEDEVWFNRRKQDHIDSLNHMISNNSFQTKYYIIFKYEGKPTSNWDEVYESIYHTVDIFYGALQACDCNLIIHDNENNFTMETLYRFFNPTSSLTEDYESRFDRIVDDFKKYNNTHKDEKAATEVDIIAPRGLYFNMPDYWQMDGMYFTHLIVHGNSIPENLTAGWMDSLISNGVDMDMWIQRKPSNMVTMGLEASLRTKHMFTPNKKKYSEMDGGERFQSSTGNIKFIQDALNEKQDYYEFIIFLTIKSPSLNRMYNIKSDIITRFKRQPFCISFEECYKDTQTYFNMYMPFMNISNKLFTRFSRGCVTESLMGLFPFTFRRTFDDTGFVLGINEDSGDITAINNFNRKYYSNANISIVGTSGSGKTYFMAMLTSHMLFTGIRTFFLCPVKGHELSVHIKSVGGTVIDFIPGSFDCFNLFEIRPEINLDAHEVQESSSIIRGSLLVKKITQIITFTQLALGKNEYLTSGERNKLNILLMNLYANFGITTDNDSIYLNKEKRILKRMPIFTDVYNEVIKDNSLKKIADVYLPFVQGTFRNFNGPTNVSLSNSAILVNVDENHIGKDMLPAIAYLGFVLLYDLVKESRLYLDALVLDELWKLLINDDVGEQIFELVKVIRGYGGCSIVATQDINDMMDNKWGRAILSNSSIKIVKKLEGGVDSECEKVCSAFGITEDRYKMRIENLSQEEALIVSGKTKILTLLKSTELENVCFVTDDKGLRRRMEYMQKHNYTL